jgi:excisionase family DNA binding protein
MTETPAILSRDQVAAMLDCEPDTVDIAARNGVLPGLKFGRSWVFPQAALLEFLNQRALSELPGRNPIGKARLKDDQALPAPPSRGAPRGLRKRVID